MIAILEPAARLELLAAIRWYLDEAGVRHAQAFQSEIERMLKLLTQVPEIGAEHPRGTRSIPLRVYPFILHYVVEADCIRILAVAHQKRRPGYWIK